ncbi:hypothetical protein [Aequorivita marina]|uniref:hypothetical protein n=1 Tax=Aequorivita marina TaxID=3073654 RepID=UPI00287647AA|nr:hypothetical protein [Aequorivita sp. S2608]MDS1299233.1 hypothetical protein [Aequorivita sp. S2608]
MKTKVITPLFVLIFISLTLISCQETIYNPDPGPSSVKPPKEIISVAQAAAMHKSYSLRRVPIIKKYEDSIASDTSAFTPTRYAEYDLETIKQYVAYVEYMAKQAKVDVKTLRFYLSNYPNSEKFENGEKVKYPRRNSLFVLPTMEYKGKNHGFSIEEVNGKYTAVPINRRANNKNNLNKTQNDSIGRVSEAGFFVSGNAAVQEGETSSLILNDGQIMPPPPIDDFDIYNEN